MRPMRLMGLMGLMGLMSLMGCSSEDAEPAEKLTPVELMGVVTQYEEATEATRANGTNEAYEANGAYGPVTRAWTPPTGYTPIGDGNHTIGAYLTQNGQVPNEGYFYSNGSSWHTTLDIETAGNYYLYGYMPHISGVTSTISSSATANDNSAYSSGAVLTLRNVPAVTANDVCVLVGAKNGRNDYVADAPYSVTGLRRGDFGYEVITGEGNNKVFLLFDHLYSALSITMAVDREYNALRTIKLKELYLQTSASGTVTKKRFDITVTLRHTESAATNPISNIVYTPVGTDEGDGTMLSASEPDKELSTTPSTSLCHFMPQGVDKFKLTSVYDVYDKKGNKVRENCKVTNTISVSKLFDRQTETLRGTKYTIHMTIQPTYLYVLSEPDLDDPTVVVN